MNTLTGFNSPAQIIQSLYNLSVFQSYQPGFNTIQTQIITPTILDITHIDVAQSGYNVLIKPPEINFSVATVGGIDNSGGILTIGLNASSIIIGNPNHDININGHIHTSIINASTIISYGNMVTSELLIFNDTSNNIYHMDDTSGITLIPGLWSVMSTGNISVLFGNNTIHWGITDQNFSNGDINTGFNNIASNTTYFNTSTEILCSNTLTAILRVDDTKHIYSSVYVSGQSDMSYYISGTNSSFIAHRIC